MTDKPKLTVVGGKEDSQEKHEEHAGKHLRAGLEKLDIESLQAADYLLTIYTSDTILLLTNLPSAATINLHIDATKLNLLMGGVLEGD